MLKNAINIAIFSIFGRINPTRRRVYPTFLFINGREIRKVIIDPHYEIKHKSSINDAVILSLVKTLNGTEQMPASVDKDGFEYYVKDRITLTGKTYKLIWLLHEEEIFIGIVNAYRRD